MTKAKKARNRSILDMSAEDARAFLLKQESYCTIDLPPYFTFEKLLWKISGFLDSCNLSDLINKPGQNSEVNYKILSNKDGKYGWRPLELCHPVLYVNLVNQITENANWKSILEAFEGYKANKKIQCLSLPVQSLTKRKDKAEQILHWWSSIEQKSIELAISYEFVIHADVTDCYGSIYTHSIAWALHTKAVAKDKRNDQTLIGNVIDNSIQNMRNRQTNGIPQGSVLMDFIAEMVLGYADVLLAEKVESQGIKKYRILRYRDDYRIFVNDSFSGEVILKCLTEVLFDLGMKLNPSKTLTSSEVIQSSVKQEKLSWIGRKQYDRNLQKHLLIIHNHASQYPNAGSLFRALERFCKRLDKMPKDYETVPLISIVVDIAYRNPKTYPICMVIISKLLSTLTRTSQISLLKKIRRKFSLIPNVGFLEIWLQRLTLPRTNEITFDEPLCKLAAEEKVPIWNNDWVVSNDLKKILRTPIVNRRKIRTLAMVVALKEIQLFGEYE